MLGAADVIWYPDGWHLVLPRQVVAIFSKRGYLGS
jgi:hypothetical protein